MPESSSVSPSALRGTIIFEPYLGQDIGTAAGIAIALANTVAGPVVLVFNGTRMKLTGTDTAADVVERFFSLRG